MIRTAIRSALAIALIALCTQKNGAQSTPPQITAAVIPAGQLIILQLDTPLHTRTTRKGEKVEFHTAADVFLETQILIPNGTLVHGTVTKSKRAGLLYGRAEIRLHFDKVRLADGTELPIQASITRAGFDPVGSKTGEDPKLKGETGQGGDAKAVVEAGAQGALLGIIYGGPRGAIYGAAAGAASTVITSILRRGPDVDLPRSTMFEARFDKPLEIPAAVVAAQNAPASIPPPDIALPGSAAGGSESSIPVSLKETATGQPPEEGPKVAAESTAAKTGTSSTGSAEPTPGGLKFGVKVRLVQVDAVVKDRSGRAMEGLRQDDFRIYEDGLLQELARFSRDELPLAVGLVVDCSGSVAPYIAELRKIAVRALSQLKPQDEVCLFSFAGDVQLLEDLTTDRRRVAEAIDRIRAGGNTDIVDALHESVVHLSRGAPDRRHAIILISDNQQTAHPQASEMEVVTAALETDTVVYSLKTQGVPTQLGNQLPSLLFGDAVTKIARESGGEVIKVAQVYSMHGALGTIISRLRTRYSLGYYPSSSKNAAFHSITVRLSDHFGKAGSDYFIHAKRGYYATGSQSSI
jgi:Ca-activated chloride channel homolog